MSIKNPNDPKIPDHAAPAQTSPQPQERFGSPNEEDAIPWAELLFEEEPNPVSGENPMVREPQPAEMPPARGFLSRISEMNAEYLAYDTGAGPPLAVLAVALLVFVLLLETS